MFSIPVDQVGEVTNRRPARTRPGYEGVTFQTDKVRADGSVLPDVPEISAAAEIIDASQAFQQLLWDIRLEGEAETLRPTSREAATIVAQALLALPAASLEALLASRLAGPIPWSADADRHC